VTTPDEYAVSRLGPGHPIPHHEPKIALTAAGEASKEAGVPYALERISADAVDTIVAVAVADAKSADLIVVGSRGSAPSGPLCWAAFRAACSATPSGPVLIVKAEKVPAGVESSPSRWPDLEGPAARRVALAAG